MRKPSSLAVLKNLPETRQAEIYSRCSVKHAGWEDTSYFAVRKWLLDDGITTSEAALSLWFSWYSLRSRLEHREQKIQSWLECEKLEHPELTDGELFRRGQRKFTLLTLAEEDPDGWVKIQKTAIDREELSLADRRVKLLEQKAAAFDKVREAVNSGGLTPETLSKIERELNLL